MKNKDVYVCIQFYLIMFLSKSPYLVSSTNSSLTTSFTKYYKMSFQLVYGLDQDVVLLQEHVLVLVALHDTKCRQTSMIF